MQKMMKQMITMQLWGQISTF